MIYSASPKPENVGGYMEADGDSKAQHDDQMKRSSIELQDNSGRFVVKDRNFNRQYAHLYAVRLLEMRKKLTAAASKKWGKNQENR